MAAGYSWNTARDEGGYRLPGPDHLGWWAAVAMLLSILLHVIVFFALDRMKIALKFEQARELSTRPIDISRVEVRPLEPERSLPPEEIIKPSNDSAALLDEIELLSALPKNEEIDIKPETLDPSYALQIQKPASSGSPEAMALETTTGFEIEADLPEIGRQPETIRPAEIGQITVDPGIVSPDDSGIGKFTDDLIKKGANGTAENGTLDGITSLDSLLDLPPNILLSKKTMLPSDLLFDFNSSELRESAKVGLMKLTMLIDRNPDLYCWIEGHTDLVGSDDFNLSLSVKRAEAVKNHLVQSYKMDASKIITRGFGRYQPIVTTGDAQEQSINRRVEIRMRKTPPTEPQMRIAPPKAAIIEEAPPPAIVVVPQRAQPVEEMPAPPPRAAPVEETPPLRAIPTFPEVPRASPVEQEIPRAIPRAQAIEEP